jgi:hypothetical protein
VQTLLQEWIQFASYLELLVTGERVHSVNQLVSDGRNGISSASLSASANATISMRRASICAKASRFICQGFSNPPDAFLGEGFPQLNQQPFARPSHSHVLS